MGTEGVAAYRMVLNGGGSQPLRRNATMMIVPVRIRVMDETAKNLIIGTVLAHYPRVQGIYLFGSHGTEDEWPDIDVDIALLLPHEQSNRDRSLILSRCRIDLEDGLHKEVDVLNAREVSTVFQKELIGGRLICCADRYAVDEFEMLVLSYYQKLNEERRVIVEAFLRTGRAHPV